MWPLWCHSKNKDVSNTANDCILKSRTTNSGMRNKKVNVDFLFEFNMQRQLLFGPFIFWVNQRCKSQLLLQFWLVLLVALKKNTLHFTHLTSFHSFHSCNVYVCKQRYRTSLSAKQNARGNYTLFVPKHISKSTV